MREGGTSHTRINITLPRGTMRLLEEHAPKGARSQLIDRALRYYLDEQQKAELRRQLAEGYRRNRRTNRELAEEWRPLEEQVWLGQRR